MVVSGEKHEQTYLRGGTKNNATPQSTYVAVQYHVVKEEGPPSQLRTVAARPTIPACHQTIVSFGRTANGPNENGTKCEKSGSDLLRRRKREGPNENGTKCERAKCEWDLLRHSRMNFTNFLSSCH